MPDSFARSHILLVEPHDASRAILRAAVRSLAYVETHATFETARARLGVVPFDFLVTNIRLGAYNGLHLVYLVSTIENAATRAIVYSEVHDLALAREAQLAGAFYETRQTMPITLTAYLRAELPPKDRRDPATRDRRAMFRGGRRAVDAPGGRQY
jgi:DNA-binding NtrC family response regulator